MNLAGHYWTILPHLRDRFSPPEMPAPTPWETVVDDPDLGRIRLTGKLREVEGAGDLLILIHGLGGGPDSPYVLSGAEQAYELDVSTLCLSLRGSDRLGEDFYNIALTADLHAAVASPALAHYDRIFLLGYSMGGHVALHYACEPADERVRAVGAVCTPMNLAAAQRCIDHPRAWFYRRHVLAGLKDIYRAVGERRDVPTATEEVLRVRTIYDWDRLAIVPRYGFPDVETYYDALSIGPRLGALDLPALLVATDADPLIPPQVVLPYLPNGVGCHGTGLDVAWTHRGGHLSFPEDLDLGLGPWLGLAGQIYGWFRRQN